MGEFQYRLNEGMIDLTEFVSTFDRVCKHDQSHDKWCEKSILPLFRSMRSSLTDEAWKEYLNLSFPICSGASQALLHRNKLSFTADIRYYDPFINNMTWSSKRKATILILRLLSADMEILAANQ